MAKLTTAKKNAEPKSDFGLPEERKYPMPDAAHARNAKARASQEENAGANPIYPCCKFRGNLVAVDAKSGDVIWRTYTSPEPQPTDLTPIRSAIRAERKLVLHYADRKGEHTRRTVWPIALGYFEHAQVLAAWCELREDFRHFRTDRILGLRQTNTRYPERRRALMKAWQEIEGISRPA